MKSKIVSAADAVALVHEGDTLVCSGFGVVGVPDELLVALEKRFLETAQPRNLHLLFGGGPGDGKDQGLNRIAHEGLLASAIGGNAQTSAGGNATGGVVHVTSIGTGLFRSGLIHENGRVCWGRTKPL